MTVTPQNLEWLITNATDIRFPIRAESEVSGLWAMFSIFCQDGPRLLP